MAEKAKWIWSESDNIANEYADFVCSFVYNGKGAFVLDVSAETNFVAYVNNSVAMFGQYHDNLSYKVKEQVDITSLLVIGENSLYIKSNRHHEDSCWYVEKNLGIIFSVSSDGEQVTFSGKHILSRRSVDYISGTNVAVITGQIGYGFTVNAQNAVDNEREAAQRASQALDIFALKAMGFKNSIEIATDVNLHKRPIKRLINYKANAQLISVGQYIFGKEQSDALKMQNAYLGYRDISQISNATAKIFLPTTSGVAFNAKNGVYLLIDLSKNLAGHFTLDIDAPKNTEILIAFGEHLSDLRVRSYINTRQFSLKYITKQGRQTFTDYFRRIGARYLQIFVSTSCFTLYDASLIVSEYPTIEKQQKFDDRLFNKIFEIGVHTLKICKHEHYEDTPWREQGLYAMDSRNQMLCGYHAFEDSFAYVKANLQLMLNNIRGDGLLTITAPSNSFLTIPTFSLVYFLSIYEYLAYSKDIKFFTDNQDKIENIMSVFTNRMQENGLIKTFAEQTYWNFYEWTDGMDGDFNMQSEPVLDAPLNAFFAIALSSLEKCFLLANQPQKAVKYTNAYQKVMNSIFEIFYSENDGCFTNFENDKLIKSSKKHELTNALILFAAHKSTDASTVNMLEEASKNIVSGKLIKSSLSHSIFKFDGLIKHNPIYKQYVLDNIAEVWGNMAFSGATSFYEAERGSDEFNNAGSLSHGWSAIPVYFLSKILGGE